MKTRMRCYLRRAARISKWQMLRQAGTSLVYPTLTIGWPSDDKARQPCIRAFRSILSLHRGNQRQGTSSDTQEVKTASGASTFPKNLPERTQNPHDPPRDSLPRPHLFMGLLIRKVLSHHGGQQARNKRSGYQHRITCSSLFTATTKGSARLPRFGMALWKGGERRRTRLKTIRRLSRSTRATQKPLRRG